MNKLKDIIYDYSDVVAAVLIVALTIGVVSWRISAIMGYSETPESEKTHTDVDITDIDLTPTDKQDEGNKNPSNFETDPENQTQPEVDPKQDQPANPSQGFVTKEEVKYIVEKGMTCAKIGKDLQSKGLVEDAAKFVELAMSMDKATKLKAATFTIPAGSTAEDIINILSGSKKN